MLKVRTTFLFISIVIASFSCKTKETVIKVNTPPTLFVKMQKTPCYGQCPNYELEIYDNGDVTFKGKMFVDFIGLYKSTISNSEIETIKNKIVEVNFFELDSLYDSPATDIPSCIIEVTLDNKSKKIIDRRYGPEELKDLEKIIESTVLKSNLKKID